MKLLIRYNILLKTIYFYTAIIANWNWREYLNINFFEGKTIIIYYYFLSTVTFFTVT